jgi:hypothetical protein
MAKKKQRGSSQFLFDVHVQICEVACAKKTAVRFTHQLRHSSRTEAETDG